MRNILLSSPNSPREGWVCIYLVSLVTGWDRERETGCQVDEGKIILFRIHRFFFSRKILMIRIISLNLDFGEKRTLTFPVISRVAIGAFSKKTSTPPSLQVTIDEEPVPLV